MTRSLDSIFPGRILRTRNIALLTLIILMPEFWMACNKKDAANADPVSTGRTLYALHCTACHNPDPTRDGSLGPAIKGSALELIQARVMRGEYPPGYTPKRATHIMMKLPLGEAEVEALHAFLNAP